MEITAIQPYYDVGTATLNTANRNMTGVGTQWLANIVAGDQVYGADGRMGGVVETVNSNTSITLTKNWRGANQSGGVYTIFRVSDSVRVENFSQRLLNLLLGGNLTSLGDLALAANKGIHATGVGALATHDLTPAARAILALVGAAGAKIPVVTGTGAAALRDIVGTVGQSGGVPNNAIIERGSNANGDYVRLADGTQMCWNLLNAGPIALGSGSYNDPWRTAAVTFTFPATFAAVPAYSLFCYRNDGTANARISYGAYAQNPANTAVVANIRGMMASSTAADVNIVCTAMGRWF